MSTIDAPGASKPPKLKRKQDALIAVEPESPGASDEPAAKKKKKDKGKEARVIEQAPEPVAPKPKAAPKALPSINELALGSNDDILAAIQGMGRTKIPGSKPKSKAKTASKAGGSGHKRTLEGSAKKTKKKDTSGMSHAHILSHKWLSAAEVADMVKSDGLIIKKGKFSAIEEQQLKTAIDEYGRLNGLTPEQLNDLMFGKRPAKNLDNGEESFWTTITAEVPKRPITTVYHHVRRTFHPLKGQGKWSSVEDTLLRQAIAEYGHQWIKVSENVGRMAGDCKDRYRNFLKNKSDHHTGAWSKEEEDKLAGIVTAMLADQADGEEEKEIMWTQVSEKMGSRSRQQCRTKWMDNLAARHKGVATKWCSSDNFILAHKVHSLDLSDDTEIDWKTISDKDWDQWSPHQLQVRWLAMKKRVPGFEGLTHRQILEKIIASQRLHPEGEQGEKKKIKKKKEEKAKKIPVVERPSLKKYKSAEKVVDSSSEKDKEEDEKEEVPVKKGRGKASSAAAKKASSKKASTSASKAAASDLDDESSDSDMTLASKKAPAPKSKATVAMDVAPPTSKKASAPKPRPRPKVVAIEVDSPSSSSSEEDVPLASKKAVPASKKAVPAPAPMDVDSSSEDESSESDVPKKKQSSKDRDKPVESEEDSSESESDEEVAAPVPKKVVKPKATAKEVDSDDSSSDESESESE